MIKERFNEHTKEQLRGKKVDVNPLGYGVTNKQVENEIEYYRNSKSDIDIEKFTNYVCNFSLF